MIKGILIDDEWPAIQLSKRTLEASGEIKILASTDRSSSVIHLVHQYEPDIVFIDIKMPEIDGLQVAASISSSTTETFIVFVTAYDYFALEAFKYEALDYLMKPLTGEHVERVITRWKKRTKRVIKNETFKHIRNTAESIQISTLGALKIGYPNSEQQLVKWRTSKTAELFAFFILQGAQGVSKDKMMESLWPEFNIGQATSHLHTTIYKLKSALKKAEIESKLIYREGSYRLELFNVSIDLVEFTELVQRKEAVHLRNVDWMEQKLSLYKGHLFGDKDYPWSLMEREIYLAQFVEKSNAVAQFYLEHGDYQNAKKHLLKILSLSPFDEETHRRLLEVYMKSFERAAFIRHYHAMVNLFREELNIGPSKLIKQIYDQFIEENALNG